MEYVNRGASSYLPCCTCSVPTSGIARMCPDWAPCVWAPRLAHTHAGDEQKWMYWKSPRLRPAPLPPLPLPHTHLVTFESRQPRRHVNVSSRQPRNKPSRPDAARYVGDPEGRVKPWPFDPSYSQTGLWTLAGLSGVFFFVFFSSPGGNEENCCDLRRRSFISNQG